jgi:dTDP-4-dehydrorhamnose 3,5-epimerase
VRFIETGIAGAWLIEPAPRFDERGNFFRAWCTREFQEQGIEFTPLQANMGFSLHKGTVRGLHYQTEAAPEAKLVRCTRGAMFDVVVDLRPGSLSWGKWFGVELTPENGCMLYLPALCGHGYQTLEDNTEMYYMTSAFYAPDAARGARFDDPVFAIRWPIPPVMVSGQDLSWPLVATTSPEVQPFTAEMNPSESAIAPEPGAEKCSRVEAFSEVDLARRGSER